MRIEIPLPLLRMEVETRHAAENEGFRSSLYVVWTRPRPAWQDDDEQDVEQVRVWKGRWHFADEFDYGVEAQCKALDEAGKALSAALKRLLEPYQGED